MIGSTRALFQETLLIWVLFSGGIGSQSFLLLPQYSPRLSSCKWKKQHCSTTSALFVGNYDPSFAINKRLVELGKKKQWKDLLALAEQKQASFNNVNYATLMSQLGRIRSFNKRDPRFLTILTILAAMLEEQGLLWIEARQAANIIHAIGKMKLRNPSAKRILKWISTPETAAAFVEEGEPQEVANVAWACTKLGFEAPDLFTEIERQSKWLIEEGTPQAVANTAWACATLGFEAPNLFAEIEHQSKWLVEEGKPQEVANTAWACATLGFEAPNLLAEIEHRSQWLVETGDAQAVANTAWACAKLGFEAPELFAEIEDHSKWLVEEGIPQAVSNTAWACATLGFEAPNLFAEIEHRSKWLVEEGTPQAVANMAWACATLGFEAPNLFAEIERKSKWLVEKGDPQAVSNVALACAKLGFEAPKLFAEVERRSEWLVKEGNSQDAANTAWACATLGFEAPRMFAEIERRCKWLVEKGTPQNVANTAWACATLGYEVPNLFAEIDCQSKWLVNEGTPQAVANTAWACATLGYEASEFFFELGQHADRLLEHGNLQNISNTCYAIAVLGMSKGLQPLLAKLWERAIELFALDVDFINEELHQLAQTLSFAEADGVKLPQIPERMAKRMELASNSTEEHIVSRSSKDVSQLLHKIGFHHQCEVSPDSSISGGMLAIDFACSKRMIAIEYDGPSHFLKAVGSGKLTCTENGATKAKRRYLEQLSWTVINIDYRDRIQANSASNEKQWLRKILNASGVSLSIPNEQIPKFEIEGTADSQKGLNERQQKKAMLLPAPAINNRISFKNVVKKDSERFEAALVQELRERGIISVPMTKSGKPDFVGMKSALKVWALEAGQ